MPTWKTTWFFEGLQESIGGTGANAHVGWTETFYQDTSTNIEDALEFAQRTAADTYLGKRLRCLANAYSVKWARVSQVDKFRLVKTGAASGDGTAPGQAGQINCALLVDLVAPPLSTEGNHHRRFLLRGLSQGMIVGNVINNAHASWARVVEFLQWLARGPAPVRGNVAFSPWKLQVQDPTTVDLPLSALAVDPSGFTITATFPHPDLAAGDRIRLRRVAFPRSVNRVWTVRAASPTNGAVDLGTSRVKLAGTWDGTGVARGTLFRYAGIGQYLVIGLRNKKTGRPFNLTRGRRRIL